MNALASVERTRKALNAVAWLRAAMLGGVAGVVLWFATQIVMAWLGAPAQATSVVVGLLAAVATAWRIRARVGPIDNTRAALWLEEQNPALQFVLVTLSEGGAGRLTGDARRDLESRLTAGVVRTELGSTMWRRLRAPAGTLLLLVIATVLAQAQIIDRVPGLARGSRSGIGGANSTRKSNAALANWRVRVVPPTYSGGVEQTLGDAGSVSALVGSHIVVTGSDAETPQIVYKSIEDSTLTAPMVQRTGSGTWTTTLDMPRQASALRFSIGAAARQLLLDPHNDSLPVVQLRQPTRDSVLRAASGTLMLDADAHDDIGLATAAFELIVSSGEGERFTARTVVISPQRYAKETNSHWQAVLSLDTMHLEQGDIVHLRAMARDRHPDTARGVGASETRTFRIARAREYDSVAVDPAPPPEVDKSLMSQRMLLILTEKLEQRRPTLKRTVLVEESLKLASEQARLRKAVGDLVFQRLQGEDGAEHSDAKDNGVSIVDGKLVVTNDTGGPPVLDFEGDESPVVAINRPLLEAYNAMWEAAGALNVAEPKAAIPHMRAALAAIQKARSAERIYLRGKPPVVVVDIAKVRLAGKDTGQANARTPREPLSPREAQREARMISAALLFQRDAGAARDSLAVLRLESVTDAPRFASALSEALEVARKGGDVTNALVRARRMLGTGALSDSLGVWRGR